MTLRVPEIAYEVPKEDHRLLTAREVSAYPQTDAGRRQHRYLRAPEPVYFPVSEKVPETKDSYERRAALYQSVKRELATRATIGSDQFVYYDPTTPRKCLAPDVFVRLGVPDHSFEVWKTWERGTPELGVEIVSASDQREPIWDEKLERYRAAGFREVVAFDATHRKHPIRVWDLMGGDLVERSPDDPDMRYCEALGQWWVVVRDPAWGPMLRLARDRDGRGLLPTDGEAEAKAREAEAKAREAEAKALAQATRARDAEAKAREEKERLTAELAALRAQMAEREGVAHHAPGKRAGPRKRLP